MRSTYFMSVAFFVITSTSILACKQKNDSSVQSLDNFAGGSAVHQCSGTFTNNAPYMKYVLGGSSSSRSAVEQALSALPAEVKDKVFFGGAKVSISLTSDVTAACLGSRVAEAYGNQPNKPFLSCHKPIEGNFIIFSSDAPAQIKQGLVRAIAYYLTEVDTRLAQSGGRTLLKPVDSPELSFEKDVLALSFLSDVAHNKNFSSKVFEGMLLPSVLRATNDAQRSKAWFSLAGPDAIARQLFSSYVFAEAMDSFYCSDSSRQAVVSNFPKTATILGLNDKPEGASLTTARIRPIRAVSRYFFPNIFQGSRSSNNQVNQQVRVGGTNKPQASTVNRKSVYSLPTSATYYDQNQFVPQNVAQLAKDYGRADASGKFDPNIVASDIGLIKYDPTSSSYSGYSGGGSYIKLNDGSMAWKNADGSLSGRVAKLNAASGQWDYSQNAAIMTKPAASTVLPAPAVPAATTAANSGLLTPYKPQVQAQILTTSAANDAMINPTALTIQKTDTTTDIQANPVVPNINPLSNPVVNDPNLPEQPMLVGQIGRTPSTAMPSTVDPVIPQNEIPIPMPTDLDVSNELAMNWMNQTPSSGLQPATPVDTSFVNDYPGGTVFQTGMGTEMATPEVGGSSDGGYDGSYSNVPNENYNQFPEVPTSNTQIPSDVYNEPLDPGPAPYVGDVNQDPSTQYGLTGDEVEK
jgi:hypothetical protein